MKILHTRPPPKGIFLCFPFGFVYFLYFNYIKIFFFKQVLLYTVKKIFLSKSYMTLRAYGAEPHIENFKQPIFNFCRRIGKKFLSNIGVSSKQNSFLKNFSLISFFYTFIILKIFYLRNPIGKFQTTDFKFLSQKDAENFSKSRNFFQKQKIFPLIKIFSSEPHIEKSKHPILNFCRTEITSNFIACL